jgi:AbrB family looped-hinge helix DNA binding protein
MKNTIRMDAAGRIVIPQRIREKYGLERGSHRLQILESPEGILLRPEAEEIRAERHASGWVVFRSAEAESVDAVGAIAEGRAQRDSATRGDVAPA